MNGETDTDEARDDASSSDSPSSNDEHAQQFFGGGSARRAQKKRGKLHKDKGERKATTATAAMPKAAKGRKARGDGQTDQDQLVEHDEEGKPQGSNNAKRRSCEQPAARPSRPTNLGSRPARSLGSAMCSWPTWATTTPRA